MILITIQHMSPSKKSIISFLILLSLLTACANNKRANEEPITLYKPELIIYCENGVISPIYEISKYFEIRYSCKVTIQNGNVRNLTSMIDLTNDGDIFIPDTNYGFDLLSKKNKNIINDSLYIGTNKLVYMFPKGNLERFDGKLESLSQKKHAVIIANPETSSLGHKTREVLLSKDLYNQVINNIMTLSIDSRGLIQSIVNEEATLTVDWLSSYYDNNNSEKIDTMHFMPSVPDLDIYASTLSTSKNPGLAQTFLAVLSSPQAVEILKNHGIEKKHASLIISQAFNTWNENTNKNKKDR